MGLYPPLAVLAKKYDPQKSGALNLGYAKSGSVKLRMCHIERMRWCVPDLTNSEQSPPAGSYWRGNEPSGGVNEGPATTLWKRVYEPSIMVLEP